MNPDDALRLLAQLFGSRAGTTQLGAPPIGMTGPAFDPGDPLPKGPVSDPIPERLTDLTRRTIIPLPGFKAPLVFNPGPDLKVPEGITDLGPQSTGVVSDPTPDKIVPTVKMATKVQGNLGSATDKYPISIEDLRGLYPDLQARDPAEHLDLAQQILDEHGGGAGLTPRSNTPEKLAGLLTHLEALADLGSGAQDWYKRSGEIIQRMTQQSPQAAERLAELLAAGAQRMDPKSNLTTSLRALSSYLANPTDRSKFDFPGTGQMIQLFGDLLYGGDQSLETEKIRKRSTFKGNISHEILPDVAERIYQGTGVRSTQDMVMNGPLVFGSGGNAPTPNQYKFYETVMRHLGPVLGDQYEHQTQARIWTGAQMLKDILQRQSEPDKPTFTRDELNARNNVDFSHAMDRQRGQISWEAIPGSSTGHLPELLGNPDLQQEYTRSVARSFLDEHGNDRISQAIGLPAREALPGQGVYLDPATNEVSLSPGMQTEVALPAMQGTRADPNDKKKTIPIKENYGRVDPEAVKLAEADAAARGLAARQNSAGWTRPLPDMKSDDQDVTAIRIGRPITSDETREILDRIQSARDKDGNPLVGDKAIVIPTRDGAWIKNVSNQESPENPDGYRAWSVPNKVFQKTIKTVVRPFLEALPEPYTAGGAGSDGRLVKNDWGGKEPNGEGYLARLTASGRPDILRATHDVLSAIEQHDREFAAKHGLTFREHPAKDRLRQLLEGPAPLQGAPQTQAAD